MQSFTLKYSCKAPSFSPKSTFYSSNGSGRDSYIATNNGGLCPNIEPRVKISSTNSPIHRGYHEPSPVMTPKIIHYNADGTGRDTYIIRSSGGMHRETTYGDFQCVFENKLREYKTLPEHCFIRVAKNLAPLRTQTSEFAMRFYPRTYPLKQKLLCNYQSRLTRRLSLPKFRQKQPIA